MSNDSSPSSALPLVPLPSIEPRRFVMAAVIVFLAAVGVRSAFFAWRGPLVTLDGEEYALIAQNIREHGVFSVSENPPFVPTGKRPPLYPAFLTVFGTGTETLPTAVFAAQILVDSLVAVAVLFLALHVLPFRWAMGAALAYAVHPAPMLYTAFLLTESLYTALLALAATGLTLALRARSLGWTALAGAALGGATLCRPVALLMPVAFGLVLLASAPPRRFARAGLLVACALAVIAPWVARSSMLEGRLVLVQSEVSAAPMAATKLADRVVVTADGETIDPAKTESGWILRDVLRHPFRFLTRTILKLPNMLLTGYGLVNGITPKPGQLYGEGRYGLLAVKLAMMGAFAALPFVLACVGLVRARRAAAAKVCASVWLYVIVIHLPFWVEYRFWVPATPFLLVSAAAGAHLLASRLTKVKP